MRRILGVLVVVAAAAAAGCKDQGPVAGELSVQLTSPRTTDRAVLFRVTGPAHGVKGWTASANYHVISDTSATGDTSWIAVITSQGTFLASGEIARFEVPDTRRAGSYVISLTEAAAADYSVGAFAGMALAVVKP